MCHLFCIYVSALPLPTSAFSKAFDCKGEEGSKESEGKRGKATQLSCDEHSPRGSEGRKKEKVKSEEGRVKSEESKGRVKREE